MKHHLLKSVLHHLKEIKTRNLKEGDKLVEGLKALLVSKQKKVQYLLKKVQVNNLLTLIQEVVGEQRMMNSKDFQVINLDKMLV